LNLRALLVCENVRVEVDGTLTLIGVRNDRLRVRATAPPIALPHLSFLLVVGGLTGVENIGFRERIQHIHDRRPAAQPLQQERHDPTTDEHNFVFGHSPMVFPEFGSYEVIVDVETTTESATYRHRFGVESVVET
jgi:hypothetical protein